MTWSLRMMLGMLVVVAAGAACDFQKIGNQATARAVAVSTLLTTPPVELKPEAVAGNGFDAGLGDLDGGALLDAGLSLGDAGLTIPGQNLAFVFFGQRQGESLDTAPTGVPGAQVSLLEVGGGRFALTDQGGGNYSLVEADGGFVYRDGATYNFEIVSAGATYVAEVVRVPPRENIAQFRPPAGYVELNAGEAFTFTRPDPPMGEDRHLGFINVFPVNREGQQGQPTYTNVPTTPLEFLKLVVAPNDWKKTTVTIPGAAFPNADANYLVVLQSAKLGGPKSDNLFTGSAILAGTADVAIIKTRP